MENKQLLKKIMLVIATIFALSFTMNAQIWVNTITSGRPISDTYYVGDQINPSGDWMFNFEIGQASWNASEVGIGQNTDGSTGWNFEVANWYQDGAGSNKRVRRNIGSFRFTASGTWYVVGRAKANAGDAWTWADEGGWTNNTVLTASTSTGSAAYFTVNALENPSSTSGSATENVVSLSWTKWNSKNVMVVRYARGATTTTPTGGTAYSVGNTLGSGGNQGTVVYNGSASSTTDNVLPSTNYDYYLNSENYSYYSAGVKVEVNVGAIANPSAQSVSVIGTTATLNWTKNAEGKDVMIVRYAKGATPTSPTQGTPYNVNNTLGSGGDQGTVIYKSSGTTHDNTITGGNEYDYYFYSESWSYYSSGVTATFEKPTVATPSKASIAPTSATLGANVTATGNGAITRGTVFGTEANPTGNSLAEGGTTTGAFTHSRTGLTANTLYYYRGYANNTAGTSYSADDSFTTLPATPTVGAGTGANANSFTANWSAPTQGAATFTYEVQASTNNTTWASPINVTDIASGNTSVSVSGLEASTTYYFRVRTTNAQGSSDWSASSLAVATTSGEPLAPTATAATSISTTGFTANWDASAEATSYRLDVSTTDDFSSFVSGFNNKTVAGTSDAVGSLANGTTYYYRVRAVNAFGTSGQSNTISVTTYQVATVTTQITSEINSTTAVGNGNITVLGSPNPTQHGHVWSTNPNPTTADSKTELGEKSETGAFSSLMLGLEGNTTYYVRAYVTNAAGTVYGEQVSFTTTVYVNRITAGRPISVQYLGDKLTPEEWFFNFEIGQPIWNASQVGIGQNPDGATGWSWEPATWYQDGEGSNRKVRRDLKNYQFTATGTWFVVGRARLGAEDAWTYADEESWTNNTTLTASTEHEFTPYFTVNSLENPSNLSAITFDANRIDLTWEKWNDKHVIVLRNTANSFTDPTQGTTYTAGNTIGDATVVYVGDASSINNTGLTPGTTYYYKFYSENFGYYSEGTAVQSATTQAGWAARDTERQASENPSYFLGDNITFHWDVNGIGWTAPVKKAGLGTVNNSNSIDWQDIVWVDEAGDGVANNEGVRSAEFTATASMVGTMYYSLWLGWGAEVGANGGYHSGTADWTVGNPTFQSSTFTVNNVNNPSAPTVAVSGTTATLGWAKNAQSNDVMIVRYTKGAGVTAPTQGQTYNVSDMIGTGTVVYRGAATSTTNEIVPGNEYDYYFYSENWSYYSVGTVKATFEKPTLTTPNVVAVNTITATIGATITDSGNGAITTRGTVFGTSPNPTTNAVAEGGTSVGAFSHLRNSLTANTFYYFRGYASNTAGVAYSPDGTFTTLPAAPTVGNGTSVESTSFTANWSHPTQGSVAYTYEIVVSTNNATWLPVAFTASGIASANTSVSVTGLTEGTTYYFRVRATNVTGSGAWSASSVAVTTSQSAAVTTQATSSIATTTATANGNVTALGIPNPIQHGHVWSTSSNPTTDNSKTELGEKNSTGSFTSSLSGLSAATLYYVRAYVVNNNGTVYGNEVSFTTLPVAPVASAATSITSTSFTANWSAVTGASAYRLDVSTVSNFSSFVDGYQDLNVAGTNHSVVGLSPNNVYYYRVRAINVTGASANSSTIQVNVMYIWNGTVSTLSGNASNWNLGSVPSDTDNIVVSSAALRPLVISNTLAFNNVTVEADAKLVVAANGKLTINQLSNAGQIIIESNNTSTGQLRQTSVASQTGTIVLRKTFTAGPWQFVGMPFEVTENRVFIAGTDTPATWGDAYNAGDPKTFYVRDYDAQGRDASGTAVDQNSSHWMYVPSRTFAQNKGYIIAVPNAVTLDFVSASATTAGLQATGSKSVSKYTTNVVTTHNSWNLIGQPFLTGFDLLNATQAHAPYYYYNGATYVAVMESDSYVVYPFSAVFVQAHGAGATVEYASQGRTLRSVSAPSFEQITLVVQDNIEATYTDNTRIRVEEGRTVNYELGKDAVKMLSMNTQVPQIYTRTKGTDNVTYSYAVNSLPTSTTIVDLVVTTGKAGSYTVSLENIDDASSYSSIILVVGSQEYDLLEGSYTFSTSQAQTMNWKVKLVQGVVTQVAQTADNGIDVATINNKVYINGLESEATVSVYNVSGQLVQTISNVQNNQALTINNAGVSVVTITTATQQAQAKVLVE
jgi:hypothetical protein